MTSEELIALDKDSHTKGPFEALKIRFSFVDIIRPTTNGSAFSSAASIVKMLQSLTCDSCNYSVLQGCYAYVNYSSNFKFFSSYSTFLHCLDCVKENLEDFSSDEDLSELLDKVNIYQEQCKTQSCAAWHLTKPLLTPSYD